MKTNQAIIKESSNRIALATPWNADFVSDLKAATVSRKWDGGAKTWTVEAAEADVAIAIAGKYFDVVDARQMSAGQVEDAKLAAELAVVRDDQKYILSRREWIEGAIEALNENVRTYSSMSTSRVKARKSHDATLFYHALRYAQMPVEDLTEMQIRSLSSARRLAEGNSITSLLASS